MNEGIIPRNTELEKEIMQSTAEAKLEQENLEKINNYIEKFKEPERSNISKLLYKSRYKIKSAQEVFDENKQMPNYEISQLLDQRLAYLEGANVPREFFNEEKIKTEKVKLNLKSQIN